MSASITPGYSFASTEQVTAAKLATLVSGATITGLTNTEIASDAAIAYSKINVTAAAINYDRLNLTGGIVNADINASAAIVASKLDLTSPGAIGSTAASTGAFSTLKVGTTNQGDVLYDNGTSLVRLTPGTSGQFLKTQGSAANPIWANVTTPALTFISNTAVSAATTTGNISLTSGVTYFVQYSFVNFSAGSNTLNLRFNADSGNNYRYTNSGITSDSTTQKNSVGSGVSAGVLGRAINNNTTLGIMGGFYIRQAGSSSQVYQVWGQTNIDDEGSGNWGTFNHSVRWENATNVTSFVLYTSASANMTGNVYLYSVATS